MRLVARDLQRSGSYGFVLCAYLEINAPSIHEAIDLCFKKELNEVFLLPYFLLEGRHTQEDIPRMVDSARKKYEGTLRIVLCSYLGYHKKITEVVKERLKERGL